MFGLLRPSPRGTTCSERRELNTFYCGLCKGLDHHHGTLTRGLLSYDGVFVALLTDALVDETRAAQPDRCRCPILPVVHRETVAPDSVAMTFAASVQMLLFDQWAADRGRSLVRRFSRPHADRAHARLDELGVSLRALERFDRVQSDVEARADAGPKEAAAPTANALGLVFASIATLEGGPQEHGRTLAELGAAIGRAIYWIDALEDLDDDLRKKAFNPCIVDGRRAEGRVSMTMRLLRSDVDGMPARLASLPLARHRAVLEDILRQLRARAIRAMNGTARAPASRWAWAIAIAVFAWAWLCAVPRAFAAPKHRDAGPPDASAAATAPAGTAAPDAGSLVVAPETSSEPPPKAPEPSDSGNASTKKGGAADGGSGAGSSWSNPCSGCGNPCKGCGSTFDSCGDTCSGCCHAPENCCNGCKDCCNSCSDCGNCCKRCCG